MCRVGRTPARGYRVESVVLRGVSVRAGDDEGTCDSQHGEESQQLPRGACCVRVDVANFLCVCEHSASLGRIGLDVSLTHPAVCIPRRLHPTCR